MRSRPRRRPRSRQGKCGLSLQPGRHGSASNVSRDTGAIQNEHLALSPDEGNASKRAFHGTAAVADLAHQDSTLREMSRRVRQDTADDVHAFLARGEGKARLMA